MASLVSGWHPIAFGSSASKFVALTIDEPSSIKQTYFLTALLASLRDSAVPEVLS